MEFPREESLRWIVSRYGGLVARHGEAMGTPDLVQPNAECFPDAFVPTGDGVARLLACVLHHSPVRAGLDVGLRFIDADGDESESCGTGSCGTGGCGTPKPREGKARDRVVETAAGYLLELPAEAVGNPVVLTATLARSVGTIVLAEAGEEVSVDELGGMSELSAIVSGLGVLVLSGAYVYGKSCGGASVSRHTHLALEEAAVAVALFTSLHGVKARVAQRYLEVTQREAFAEACDWVESNPAIVTQLRTRPEVLEAGMFRCEETKGFLGKLLARRAASEEERAFSACGPAARLRS